MMTRSIALYLGLAAALFVSACESAPKATGLNAAIDAYNAGQYSAAHQQAVAVQKQSNIPVGRENAAYLAGLSAYQLGDLNESEGRLLTALRSSNRDTAAKSKAMLGQIRMDQNRPRDAASLFAEAAPDLPSEDARYAAHNAAVAYQRAGDLGMARQWAAKGGHSQTSSIGADQNRSTERPSTNASRSAKPASNATAFALQVGAFREKRRAQQAADEASQLADRYGMGAVRMFTRRDERGQTLHVVQFGSYPTRQAAAAARTRIGKLQYIVAPIGS